MAIVDCPHFQLWAAPNPLAGGPTINVSSSLGDLNGANDFQEIILQAPHTGSITKIGFATGTVGTGCVVGIRLETVDLGTGRASGTLFGTNTFGNVTVADTDDNLHILVTLNTACSITKGDFFAVKIDSNSGTPATLAIRSFTDDNVWLLPTQIDDDGSPARLGFAPCICVEYSGDVYYPIHGVWPIFGVPSYAYNTADTDEAFGLRFQLPAPMRVCGLWVWADFDGGASIELLASNDTVLESLAVDKDLPMENINVGPHYLLFDTSVELDANTLYRLVVRATEGTDVTIHGVSVNKTSQLGQLPCGVEFYLTQAPYSGSTYGTWVNTNTECPFIGLIMDGVDDGTGGASGGLITHPGMSGGMRG